MAEEQKIDQENGEKMEENKDQKEEEPTTNRNLFNLDEFEDSETVSSRSVCDASCFPIFGFSSSKI